MLCLYEEGKRGVGGRKVFFGDSPTYVNRTVRRGESFDDVFWRIYVKHQYGWTGSPAKMSRATSIVTPNWAQAMIAHVWSSHSSSLTLDPVRCVEGDRVLTAATGKAEHILPLNLLNDAIAADVLPCFFGGEIQEWPRPFHICAG